MTHKKLADAVAMGRRGGRAGTGAAKARTREQAQAAARVRWDRWRQERSSGPIIPRIPEVTE